MKKDSEHSLTLQAGGEDGRALYAKVRDSLLERILGGEWKPGAGLPAEQLLAKEYQVSHGTLRKAITLLVDQNVLVRRHGSGTFVTSHDWQNTVSQVFKLIDGSGQIEIPDVKTVDYEIGVADEQEVGKLQLRRGSKVARVRRVRLDDGRPYIAERLVLPVALLRGIEEDIQAGLPPHLYGYYSQKFGLLVNEATENLRAVLATQDDCDLLGVAPGTPLLEIDRIVFSLQGFPLEWRTSHCDTSQHSYHNITK